MSKHSVGPWKSHAAEGQEQLRDTAFIVAPENASAVVLAEVKFHPIERAAGRTAEANARLIAAAPELLSALEALSQYTHEITDEGRDLEDPDDIEDYGKIRKQVAKALAAARGDSERSGK